MARILVVDDDRDVAGTVERTLRRKAHEVIVAYGGAQALQLIKQQCPDLVVLDIMMPYKGYFLSPAHSIQDNSPLDNVLAMYEAGRKYGQYD